jgi:ribosomal-protein-alanine acetyltransferase
MIRKALPEDAEALDGLARQAGLALDTLRELSYPHAELWVAAPADEPLGFALGWLVADELEVVDVAVARAARRLGWGRRLLTRLLESASERGAVAAFLEVRASNAPAQALYLALGFTHDGERLRYYADGEDAWLFRRCLPLGADSDSPQ